MVILETLLLTFVLKDFCDVEYQLFLFKLKKKYRCDDSNINLFANLKKKRFCVMSNIEFWERGGWGVGLGGGVVVKLLIR